MPTPIYPKGQTEMPERIKLEVYINLDPTPGVFHTAESAQATIRNILQTYIPHYNPTVSAAMPIHSTDLAKLIRKDDVTVGGEFFMNDEAVVGWWCIKSTLPGKRDLYLPAHIFRKCFHLADVTTVHGWQAVVEIA
jgi:hypothetical protein